MDEMAQDNLRHVTLSHEEFTFLLRLLNAKPALGIEDDPLRNLSADQAQAALVAAGHGLQARGLIQRNDANETLVDGELLEVMGACAYPQRLLSLYHWRAGAELPTQLFVYRRNALAVLQARPAPALHEFVAGSIIEQTIDAVLRFCNAADGASPTVTGETEITQEDFFALRAAMEQENRNTAESLARTRGYPVEVIAPLLDTLAQSPAVSVFTTFRRNGADAVQRSSFTVLQARQQMWLLTDATTPGRLAIRQAEPAALRATLSEAI